MAILKSKALQGSDTGELKNKLKDLRLELIKLSSQRASKSVSNPGKMKELRRSVAKILTALNLRSIAKAHTTQVKTQAQKTHTKTK